MSRHALETTLKIAIHRFGENSDAAKSAAITLCEARGLDPFFKYATQPAVSFGRDDVPAPLTYREEWQRIVREFADQ